MHFHDERIPWELTHNGADNTWEVDSINGDDITNNADLAEAIANMKG